MKPQPISAAERNSAAALIALAGSVFLLALASLMFTREVGRIAAAWPTNALVVAMMLRARPRRWAGLGLAGLVGNIAANLVIGDTTTTALLLAASNSLEILLCAGLMRLYAGPDLDLGRQKHLVTFLVVGAGLAPMAASICAALVIAFSRGAPFWASLFSWWAPDALGLVTITPALLALTPEGIADLRRALKDGRGRFSLLVLAFSIVVVFAQHSYPVLFLIPPALILVAFELTPAGAALALLATAVAAAIMTLTGHGPAQLVNGGLGQRLAVLQLFLATLTVSVLPVAAALAKRRRLESALKDSLNAAEAARASAADAHRLALLAQEIAGVAHWWRGSAANASRWSDQMYVLHGLSREAGPPPRGGEIELYHPDDRPLILATMQAAFADGRPFDLKVRLHRSNDGEERIVVFRGDVERGPEGEVIAIFGVMRDVTDEETARRRIEESEQGFRQLAESATDVVLKVGRDDTIEYVSPSIRRYGYAPKDLIGRKGASFIHPDDLPEVLARLARRAAGERPDAAIDPSYRLRKADGAYGWVESNSSTVRDEAGVLTAFITHMRDVSERRAASVALAESELRYRVIAEQATDIITRCNTEGRFTYISPAITNSMGYAPEELLGHSLLSYMHPEDVGPALATYRAVVSDPALSKTYVRYRARHKAGDWVWLECSPTLVRDAHGAPVEFIDVTRDITRQVELEAQLLAARDAAEEAVAVKSAFLANMSHEIRTPLTAIIGFTSLLSARGNLDELAKNCVDRVASAGGALLSIVNDILDFSKLEAGQFEIDRRPASPREVLSNALSIFAPQAGDKGLALVFEPETALPDCLMIDPDRIRQITLNLVGNAIKFTDRGSVTLTARYDHGVRQLQIGVRDTGAGMDVAQQKKLFQRFSQVDASSTRRHGGTGLGLAICKDLAEAMGGDISVSSRPGRGSTFKVFIAADLAMVHPALDLPADLPTIEGLRVLVIDDDPAHREVARSILLQFGAEVTEAADGLCGVEAAGLEPFDVILMGLGLPGLEGHDAAARIRAEFGPNCDVPILAFFSDSEHEAYQARLADFDGWVTKPVFPADLVTAIAHSLNGADIVETPSLDIAAAE